MHQILFLSYCIVFLYPFPSLMAYKGFAIFFWIRACKRKKRSFGDGIPYLTACQHEWLKLKNIHTYINTTTILRLGLSQQYYIPAKCFFAFLHLCSRSLPFFPLPHPNPNPLDSLIHLSPVRVARFSDAPFKTTSSSTPSPRSPATSSSSPRRRPTPWPTMISPELATFTGGSLWLFSGDSYRSPSLSASGLRFATLITKRNGPSKCSRSVSNSIVLCNKIAKTLRIYWFVLAVIFFSLLLFDGRLELLSFGKYW